MHLQVSISAEDNFPLTPKWIRMNLPYNEKMSFKCCQHNTVISAHEVRLTNLEELSFRIVLAFPNASRAGLAWMIWSSRVPCRFNGCHNLGHKSQNLIYYKCDNILITKPFSPEQHPSFQKQLQCWQSTGWLSWCWQFSQHQILHWRHKCNCSDKYINGQHIVNYTHFVRLWINQHK